VTNAIEEDEVAIDEEKGTERAVDVEATEVDAQATPDVVDDDDVEAHVWRAQS
jgi:hypothetical protein